MRITCVEYPLIEMAVAVAVMASLPRTSAYVHNLVVHFVSQPCDSARSKNGKLIKWGLIFLTVTLVFFIHDMWK